MFMFKATSIIEELKNRTKNNFYCSESLKKKKADLYFERIDNDLFQKCDDVSIDTAVMEKTNMAVVMH